MIRAASTVSLYISSERCVPLNKVHVRKGKTRNLDLTHSFDCLIQLIEKFFQVSFAGDNELRVAGV
jgi:hypothetical protein